ncbi:hypothetical protein BGZ60DRAFT_414161 [Tricladium varicosporioides]|nr:hypothetical protein BGZ60DRAFT_414161 [Hymenoscyphus varicosporioides]
MYSKNIYSIESFYPHVFRFKDGSNLRKIQEANTYNSRDSLMVTHSTTSLPI